MIKNSRSYRLATIMVGMVCLLNLPALAAEPIFVNVDNFVRVETAFQFDSTLKYVNGEVNKFVHIREPQPLDKQSVIRMNRDTIYSGTIVDISKGATLIIPETNGRYASDPADIKKANAIQDEVLLNAESARPYTYPEYDQVSYEATYKALLELSKGVPDAARTFGKKEDVGEVRHLLGTAMGWGGLPEHEAYYLTVTPNLPVGAYVLTVKDVPVNAFWSISLYNRDGYFQENEYNANSVNSVTATPNKDGSFTIHFGGDSQSANYLHIMEGWNYTVRLYQPSEEIIEGKWIFPSVKSVK